MCSACAGDDPRPEAFASLDVSSPLTGRDFAHRKHKQRRGYGTLRDIAKRAPALIILLVRARTRLFRVFSREREKEIVNLRRLGFSQIGGAISMDRFIATRSLLCFAGSPTEIRVTRDAIVEVYGAAGKSGDTDESVENAVGAGVSVAEAEWDAGECTRRGARCDSPTEIDQFLRMRRRRAVFAYVAFVTLGAFVMWYAMR